MQYPFSPILSHFIPKGKNIHFYPFIAICIDLTVTNRRPDHSVVPISDGEIYRKINDLDRGNNSLIPGAIKEQ